MNSRLGFFSVLFLFVTFYNEDVAARQYFQQEVNYTIKVSLNDINHSLDGTVSFEYINNSPDTLHEIYIHLWPNAYKNRETALVKQQVGKGKTDLYFAEENDRGYVSSINFVSDNISQRFEQVAIDYGKIILDKPLLPGTKRNFSTPFYVKIPDSRFSRLGHDKQAYYISQWYPKPAVYDREGWHPMSYLDQGEFYSEFGNFDVTITLPSNYVVCATGELQDKDELAWLNLKAADKDDGNSDNSFPASASRTKSLRYTQFGVHDFAWFADKRYKVKKGSMQLPNSGRRVDTWAFFTPKSTKLWKNAVNYINETLYNYSVYNGDYIYSNCSVAEGDLAVSDGMEYPMVTLVTASDTFSLEVTIVHEVGHNWFYGMLGSNERAHPWMDEGLNSLNEMRWIMQKYSTKNVHGISVSRNKALTRLFGFDRMSYKDFWQLEFNIIASTGIDQPITLPSEDYSTLNYGAVIYRKTGLAFNYLRSYLGDEVFDRCMQKYFKQWSLKHPSPSDLQKIFTTESGKELSWFFDQLLKETGATDYKVTSLRKKNGDVKLTVKNKGTVDGPFQIHGLKKDSVLTSVTSEGFKGKKSISMNCTGCSSYYLDYFRNTIDLNRNNNNISAEGIFRKKDPLHISPLPKLNPSNGHSIYILPTVGWNNYNKWMAGITFYNRLIPVKKFEYGVSALYGFGDNQLAPLGSFNFNFIPRKGFIDFVEAGLKGKRFAYDRNIIRKGLDETEDVDLHYLRLEPYAEVRLRKPLATATFRNSFYLSFIGVREEVINLKERMVGYNVTEVKSQDRWLLRGSFLHDNFRTIDPYSLRLSLEANENYQKYSLTAEYFIRYNKAGKGVRTRLFAGVEQFKKGTVAYPLQLSSWSGDKDYWYDALFFGRSEVSGTLSRQMTLSEGGFKVDVPLGQSSEWLSALNISADLPGLLPLSVFIDAGTFSNAKELNQEIYNSNNAVIFDGGLSLQTGFARVYLPILRSADIKAYHDEFKISFSKRIRFEINLERLNPSYLRKQILR